MKNITERHQLILQELKKNGSVSIPELSDLMQVSGVTIRKDLKILEDKNLLFRTHGGGSINNPYAIERPINEKEFINADEKQRIAKSALDLIGQNDSIMIGSGTTVYELARCLSPEKTITVITPAVRVTLELSNRKNVEVLQLGGLIRPNSSSVAGSYAEYILENISCAVLFIGVDGIDLDFGFSISNLTEAGLNQKMIKTAQSVAVLADHTKFGKRGIGKICDIDQVQYVVTDNKIPKDMVRSLEERGIKVMIA
ncbi:DeoR/GlpR family DNA-binding transcription regulator [Dyadobacter sp. CY323]|uniref:DeoR/GlpR family DNA-binding transcription regulator n=1 Tax=Dyadobacter sp. CY323 TaxID=2907302 RepID=UPI001F2AFAAA|nr:DeoR/GlpR family DNA-binding transcription regulator [Dyadobacter sp. CY323]MCE6992643.1 DeoR/GlpR family DNA-binding transcription regulator [Dyadobacter sp. CY323]